MLAVMLLYALPLYRLVVFSFESEFHSYILLIPFISAFLIWVKGSSGPRHSEPPRRLGGILLTAGAAVVVAYWLFVRPRGKLAEDDYLAMIIFSFLLCLVGVCCLFWFKEALQASAFPLGLLIFIAPIPLFAMPPIDWFLQNGSALATKAFFAISGMPVLQDGLTFQLPDITLHIARECSGIQSSLVLLVTGLLAGYLFLRTTWARAAMVVFAVVLGLIRNGFRVFVIGELCVHIGPQMINSYIHRKGGPIFFALSLIPLFLFLLLLQRLEKRRKKQNLDEPEKNHA